MLRTECGRHVLDAHARLRSERLCQDALQLTAMHDGQRWSPSGMGSECMHRFARCVHSGKKEWLTGSILNQNEAGRDQNHHISRSEHLLMRHVHTKCECRSCDKNVNSGQAPADEADSFQLQLPQLWQGWKYRVHAAFLAGTPRDGRNLRPMLDQELQRVARRPAHG